MTPHPSDAEVPDFVAATMSIFLAVSPSSSPSATSPSTSAPKFHTRCRSLNQMDKVGLKTSDMSLNVPLQQKRHNLARSQVNSSEYFSVAFEVAGQDSGHEFLLASKGTTLAESLGTICGRRGIDLNNCEVLLEQYKTPLPILTTDTAWLGGKHITVKEKDPSENRSNKTFGIPSRKTSRSCKGRSSFFSSSTEDVISNSDSGALSVEGKPKLTKQRWSGLFGNSKDSKMELLVEKLNNYSKCGIPQVLSRHDEDLEESLYKLEDDWKEIVSKNIPTTETQRNQQTAIWELVQTEIAYIHTLKLVTDLFLACLVSLQKCNLLCDIERRRLFSNIEEISLCNINLWAKYLLPMLAAARESCSLLDPFFLLGAFLKSDELFSPYVLYCSEQSDCQKYCREKTQSNEMFTAYLAWCETQKDCQRLRLIEMLVKPMQRLTKYSLLLKAILKHTVDEKQRESLETMIERMDAFVNGVNNTLKHKEDMESLKSVIARIEGYDVVETKDEELEKIVKTHSALDLKKPMPGCNTLQKRQLITEADLKLKDSFNSKAEVRCIILTDMLLICKTTRGSQLKVIRPPYQVHRLLVQELTRETPTLALVYLSEYATPVAAFLLLSPDSKIMKHFLTSLRRAEGLYNAAKLASEDAWRVEPDSNSGSVEMGCSPISSRGLSVESEVRPISHSSDEALPQTDTLRVVVPQLGQSLPDLKEASRRWLAPPPRPLAPPPAPPRGASYPPPSPPLRRTPAIRHNTMDTDASNKSLKKFLLRKLTKLCELQRICYDQPVGSARSLKVEQSLELSKSECIKQMILALNDAAESRHFSGSNQKMLLQRAVETIIRVKGINPRCHAPFVKSITRCIEHIWGYKELYRIVEDLRLTQYDSSVEDHEGKLRRLWNALCPNVQLESRITKQWQDIGFQGDDPKTDFRGMGMLGLENLLYFAEEYNQAARHVLSHSLHPQNGYAFAIVGINMTSMTYHLLKDGTVKTHVFNVCKSSPGLRVFHQLYSFLFYEFDCFWIQSKPQDVMQFKFIRDKFEEKIREALSDPMTAFKTEALANIVNNDSR